MRTFSNPPARDPATPKRDFGQLRRLLTYTRPYRWGLLLAGLASLISTAFWLAFPQLVSRLLDTSIFRQDDLGQIDRYTGLLLLVFAGQALFGGVQNYLFARAGEGVVADIRKSLYSHLLGLSSRFFENHKTGDITSRLTSDVSTVQAVVSTALVQVFTVPVMFIATLVILFITNWKLSLFILAVVPLVIGVAIVLGRRIRKISKEFQDKIAEANASAEESIAGIRVVQTFNAEQLESDRYAGLIRQSFRVALRRALNSAGLGSTVTFTIFSSLGLIFWFGGRLVAGGEITPGQLVSFILYAFNVAMSVGTLAGIWAQVQSALGASSRIFEFLDMRSDLLEPAHPKKLENLHGEVRFEEVQFGYGERGPVLNRVSLAARPGQVVALVGPSGAGKSTLITLIPRFYDVTGGRITLDGVDIRDFGLDDLRSKIASVPQETLLFSGTLEENIRYGKPQASQAEVLEAARAANAHAFISEFPEAYQTIVGERGVKLSGGQRQRVAIARALLKNPRILILDEATSSLDSESEALVQEALDKLMQGRTTFVIAHRLSTVRGADQIVVLDKGRVVQQGTHEELLAQGGLYKDLYELQFARDITPV
ncbi:ABC transporter transmembrane domain-containing protein [uncultured Meiothermus sp.]|jgi:subfamily B ATP-binding cassette protein MsbA|uniref:ABC transporter ATP-binding protein n=1 Tax=uncultured Meiothermus sp. TaxID=157471 RepID=UPI002635096B|nr:ABC transporter transmembrane domain-containing protein [uncultured Meiothermus sp.]